MILTTPKPQRFLGSKPRASGDDPKMQMFPKSGYE